VIFADIDVRGRPESPLKTKRVFRDRFMKFKSVSFGFRPRFLRISQNHKEIEALLKLLKTFYILLIIFFW
jgi:hypothetical protein